MNKLAGTLFLIFAVYCPVYSFSSFEGGDTLLCKMYSDDLDSIEVSYFGFTDNKNDYRLHAFKGKKKHWYFVVSDSVSIHSFYKKGKNGELQTGSLLLTQSLLACVAQDEIRKKEKRKKVNDLNLYCFYKFKKDGRKLVKRIRKVEEEKSGSWVLKALGAPFKPMVSLFQSKDKKEAVKEELMKKKIEKLQEKQAELTEKVAQNNIP
ncbi:MAG: hypothetical protein WBB45_06110 [Cyclobacteriaceae bacterium]